MAIGDIVNVAPSGSFTAGGGKYYALTAGSKNSLTVSWSSGAASEIMTVFDEDNLWFILPPGASIAANSSSGCQLIEREGANNWHVQNGNIASSEHIWTPSSGVWELQYLASWTYSYGYIGDVLVTRVGGSGGGFDSRLRPKTFVTNSFPFRLRRYELPNTSSARNLGHVLYVARRVK